MTAGTGPRRARGEIERLPSGSLRVRVYAGRDPETKKRRYLVETVPAGPEAPQRAEQTRARLLGEVAERRTQESRQAAEPARPPSPTEEAEAASNGERGSGRLTIASIARLAGVSPPTVSKILNGRPGVASETRHRVEWLLREHGYHRPEKVVRAACIEVVFCGLIGHIAAEIMRGAREVAVEHGLAVGFTDARQEEAAGRDWVRELLARRPMGVIVAHLGFTPEQHELLSASGIPMVALDPPGETVHPVPSVASDNRRGAIAAARHLLELGHRRIAVITGPRRLSCAEHRLEGARMALAGAGAPLDESLVRTGARFSFDDGVDHGRDLLALPDPPTALLCGNDLQALGVYEAARQASARIPHDLAVVGFDDISYAVFSGPQLTTVRQPFATIGATAARLILEQTGDEPLAQTRIELATTLMVRSSTAPPRDAAPRPQSS
ncbi:LacI family transcriptional regulator [Glycomyces sp. TRM65418]|uniref:LacI family DNA-binding transcriptional regulator n=1 Tax=Glycomyces sp. TRM65418 TaxID=2867006 RepID=UPI001CE5AF33|nr:LacI family DNA-binding transcriptional regulator [Glycomyces sp. TRM65418]MCC3763858.1 LacI family transcriptional regulator [Glycomyces sp. TRM65418]QZD53561.1 LacI family transcriptional regulator [Glycomyces sp. TRM65418]